MLICHEISQIIPTAMLVVAKAISNPGQQTRPLAAGRAATDSPAGSSAAPAISVVCATDMGAFRIKERDHGQKTPKVQRQLSPPTPERAVQGGQCGAGIPACPPPAVAQARQLKARGRDWRESVSRFHPARCVRIGSRPPISAFSSGPLAPAAESTERFPPRFSARVEPERPRFFKLADIREHPREARQVSPAKEPL
jgi:hypothetical protein